MTRPANRRSAWSFNPRAREGRDIKAVILGALVKVSIHAPARGATFLIKNILSFLKVSIHAPARGATKRISGKAAG